MQWDAHVLPRLGAIPLRELTPDVINRFRLELEADGVGPASIRKALTLLQGVLQRACEWGRHRVEPGRAGAQAAGRRESAPSCRCAPETVEAIRDWLLRRRLVRDATLVSVLAYAGLRPGEALALTWAHVRERTLLVEARRLARRDRGHQDRPPPHGAAARSARAGPRRVAAARRPAGRPRRSCSPATTASPGR